MEEKCAGCPLQLKYQAEISIKERVKESIYRAALDNIDRLQELFAILENPPVPLEDPAEIDIEGVGRIEMTLDETISRLKGWQFDDNQRVLLTIQEIDSQIGHIRKQAARASATCRGIGRVAGSTAVYCTGELAHLGAPSAERPPQPSRP